MSTCNRLDLQTLGWFSTNDAQKSPRSLGTTHHDHVYITTDACMWNKFLIKYIGLPFLDKNCMSCHQGPHTGSVLKKPFDILFSGTSPRKRFTSYRPLSQYCSRYLWVTIYSIANNDQGEPAVSYRWTGWVWETTGWSSRLQENHQSL